MLNKQLFLTVIFSFSLYFTFAQGFVTQQALRFFHPNNPGQYINLIPRTDIVSYNLMLPNIQGSNQSIMLNDGTGLLSWATMNNLSWNINGNSDTNPTTNFIGTTDAQSIVVKTNNIERMRILATGNIGMNTTTPIAKLHIVDTVTSLARGLLLEQYGNDDISARIGFRKSRGITGTPIALLKDDVISTFSFGGYNGTDHRNSAHIGVSAAENFTPTAIGTNMLFYTTCLNSTIPIERLRITADGNIGIGCINPNHRLQVMGDIAAENGQIRATSALISTSISSCSDIRLKKNIIPLGNTLEKIKQLNGMTYYWKAAEFPDYYFNDKPQIGFIAQEVESIYPELVETNSDGYKSVDYAKFTPVLLEAIKELQKEIESLRAEIKIMKK